MHPASVGLIGASGYTGLEVARILAGHERVDLRFAASDRWQGERLGEHLPVDGAVGGLRLVPQAEAVELAKGCDVVLLATPVEASLQLVPSLLKAGARVIDLSGAFRLKEPAAFERAYGLTHPHPGLLAEAVYGLPELNGTAVPGARLVANPGCYPTAAVLALAPLLLEGLIQADDVIIDAASGTTGAGRKASEEYSFSEVADDFRAYRVLRHQHTPEIAQTLSGAAQRPVAPTFTPHLLPVPRGILATLYARLTPGRSPAELEAALDRFTAGRPFVHRARSAEAVSLRRVVGTNRCLLGLACEGTRVVMTSAIDNLVKGAAGQAVQNLNLMMGWPEGLALSSLRGS